MYMVSSINLSFTKFGVDKEQKIHFKITDILTAYI